MDRVNVLITGAGAPGAPGIIKSLRAVTERPVRIIGVDMDGVSSGFSMVDKGYSGESAGSPGFIDRITDICRNERIDVIIPLVTNELPVFASRIADFERIGVKVSVSPPDSLHTANNKYLLMKHCADNDIPAPEFYRAASWKEFSGAVERLGFPNVPVCFKPPVSNGMRGFRIIKDDIDRLDLLMNYKPTDLYITYNETASILKNASVFPELLVMEYLPGDEYSVDALAVNGAALIVVPRLREKMKMGISFVGTTVNHPEIIEYSRRIVSQLGLNGNIGFQFKLDASGIPKIIESNPRVQGTIVLCTAAGANLVYGAVKSAIGEPLADTQESIRWNVKMIRYWDEVYYENGRFFEI